MRSSEKYFLAAFFTLGARIMAEIMVGIDINAYAASIKLIIDVKEATAPKTILAT